MTRSAADVFHEAREMPTERREGFLLGACGNDLALRSKVDALLKADAEAGGFMAAPTAGGAAALDHAASRELPGNQIGRYKLLQQIGEGGMGTIWMAEQREPVLRRVALKIIKLGMDTKQVIARFEAERQALAMMDHPNIAKVLDAGATEAGRPYFAMEYIRGIPILAYCDQERLDTRARLTLFTSVCQAIQHAHQKGIIHRDIKPSNILVTMHDGVPVPKVIDFGIAKATNSVLTNKTLFTEHRQMIGTPAYMSPEQAEMSGLDVDTRSDVYSLGVLLYELLTGTTPFDATGLLSRGLAEMLRVIREEDPHKPSTRISELGEAGTRTASQRGVDVRSLGSQLRGDLDWIVMKCLEKDRTRRYETANGLAADIKRHLSDEPVTAGSPGAVYRLRKLVRRNRVRFVAGGLVASALLVAASAAVWGVVQDDRARSIALEQELESGKRAATELARLGRNAEAVAALLDQCEDALRAGDVAKAKIAIDEARKRAAEGGAEKEAQRLERFTSDLALLRDLAAIDQLRWAWADNRFADREVEAERTRDALGRFMPDPDAASAGESAARVNASVVRERIVTALDRRLRREKSASVRALLRQVDADPYRDAIRDAILSDDRARWVALARQDQALQQPPGFATFLGESEVIDVARRRALLEAAVIRRPGDVDLLMALATISFAYPSDPEESASERIRWFQAAISVDPDNIAALNDLGAILHQRGQTAAAVGCLERILALDPNHTNAQINLAVVLTAEGRPDEAIELLDKAIELVPDAAAAHCNMGIALRAKGRLDDAVVCFQRAIAFDPGSAQNYDEMGVTLAQMGRLDEAISCQSQAVAQDPQGFGACSNLGTTMQSAGHLDEAITWHRKAVELAPRNTASRLGLSTALRDAGQVDEAIATARQAVELDPKNLDAHLLLGSMLCEVKRDCDGAIACFEAAIAIDPQSADARSGMGAALRAKGMLADAIICYREAVEIDAKNPVAPYGLACALARSAAVEGVHAAGEDPVRLRQEALDELRESLALYAGQLRTGTFADRRDAAQALRAWPEDADLTSVRDAAALASLPTGEQRALGQFWADAAALLKEAETPAPAVVTADTPDTILPLLEAALERKQEKFGSDHPATVHAIWRLATRCRAIGEIDRALSLFEEALEHARATYGSENLNIPAIASDLGMTFWMAGRLDRSIPLFEESLRLWESLSGRQDPRTLLTVAKLGVNYKDAGRLEEAIPLLEEAQRAIPEYPALGWVTNHLFEALLRVDHGVAAAHWTSLLPVLRTDLGEDHLLTLVAMNNLGYALARSGQFARAEATLREVIEREGRVLGAEHLLLLQSKTNLGEMFQLAHQHALAEAVLRECVTARENAEPGSFRLASTQGMLGRVLAEQQEFAEAEPLLLVAYEGLLGHAAETPEWGSYYLPDTVEWLAELYDDWNRPADASRWRAELEALHASRGSRR